MITIAFKQNIFKLTYYNLTVEEFVGRKKRKGGGGGGGGDGGHDGGDLFGKKKMMMMAMMCMKMKLMMVRLQKKVHLGIIITISFVINE